MSERGREDAVPQAGPRSQAEGPAPTRGDDDGRRAAPRDDGGPSFRQPPDATASEALRTRLFRKQRLAALGELTGGVVHDFNNLLGVIGNSAYLLERYADDASRRTALLGQIRTATQRGADLSRQLLRFGRTEEPLPRRLALPDVTGELQGLLRQAVRSDIRIAVQVDGKPWPIQVDYGELQLALVNLCINARDAMPDGGQIGLRIGNRDIEPDEAPQLGIDAGDYVGLTVSDSGCGMPPRLVEEVSRPPAEAVGAGAGLGLEQVRGFARRAGGAVQIRSRLGHGTDVSVILPRAA